MLVYFLLLLPFSICYGYTMQMLMRRNKNQLLKVVTGLLAALGVYFMCYSYECDPESSKLSLLITGLIKLWVAPALIPLAIAIMNGLERKPMFNKFVCYLFIPAFLLGTAGVLVHVLGLGEEAHRVVSVYVYNTVISIEMIFLFVCNWRKMTRRDFSWRQLWTFFFNNTASRPLMVIGVSINVFALLLAVRLLIGPTSFNEHFYIGIVRLLFTSFILLLFCNALGQANTPWITFKSLFEPVIIVSQNEEEEEEEEAIITTESSMVLARVDQLAEELQRYMVEEKAFLQTDITIEKVATKLGTNRFYISRLVNVEQGMTFRDYVNSLRIDYAKDYMKGHPDATQEHIATICGFSSASYFNRKFKLLNGVSPQDWRKR